jgi:hypothetical protein
MFINARERKAAEFLKGETLESAGINRQEAEDERSSRGRSSDPLGPEFCAGRREVCSEA